MDTPRQPTQLTTTNAVETNGREKGVNTCLRTTCYGSNWSVASCSQTGIYSLWLLIYFSSVCCSLLYRVDCLWVTGVFFSIFLVFDFFLCLFCCFACGCERETKLLLFLCCRLRKLTQLTHDVRGTSYQRQCDVMTSHRHFDNMCPLGSFRFSSLTVLQIGEIPRYVEFLFDNYFFLFWQVISSHRQLWLP